MVSYSGRGVFVQIKARQSLRFALSLTQTIFAGIGFPFLPERLQKSDVLFCHRVFV